MTLTNGNALAGRLAKAAMDLNIPVWLSRRCRSSSSKYDGVVGAIVERDGKPVRDQCVRRGVVLACGGFPHDIERRKQLFPHAPTGKEHFSPSPEANTGDGLRLAESVGGRVDGTIPNAAAWVPDSVTTRKDGSQGRHAALHRPRQAGRDRRHAARASASPTKATRTTTSCRPWSKACKGEPEVSRLAALRPQASAQLRPGLRRPVPAADRPAPEQRLPEARRHRRRTGQADRRALRRAAGATVDEFNRDAAKGEDPAFGKGSKAYNRYQGDALVTPNPCVAPSGARARSTRSSSWSATSAPSPASSPTRRRRVLDAGPATRSRASTRSATTPPASWAATTRAPASRSARR